MGTGEFNAGGNPARDWHPIQGRVEIFLVAPCHGNQDKLRPDKPLGSFTDFALPLSGFEQPYLALSVERHCENKASGPRTQSNDSGPCLERRPLDL